MDSFLTWIGGKKALRKKIVEQFPKNGTFGRYVEVFGGAGWVLFFSERHAKIEVYNDINGSLVNLFRCIKYHPTAVQEELEYILMSREQFYDAREQIKIRGMTDIQRAAQFFILIKESFGADIRSFGLRARDMNKAKEYLNVVSNRLNKVVIENDDYRKIIKNYDKKDTLFYLDPPYYDAEKYYPDRFMLEDHLELKRLLEGIKGKFILSYNDCDYIRKLYRGYNIVEVERVHSLIQKNTKPRYQELIIKNY
ncbi:MAG: DNA adenine methylase [Hungatella sp.]|nr:DNA adenine methylase [Dorea sp.]MCI9636197.1 DNA adenine methylase [Hungatella sp.]